jgi:hypothetical protein
MEVTLDEAKTYSQSQFLRRGRADQKPHRDPRPQWYRTSPVSPTRNGRRSEEKILIRIRIAVLYTVAYLYEHREEADHSQLNLTLRALLFGVRKEGF